MTQGLGIDIVCISEFAKICGDPDSAFVKNHFTSGESNYAEKSAGTAATHLAGRYAAKEAIIKALESMHLFRPALLKHLSYRDMEVANDPHGRPYVIFYGALQEIVQELKVKSLLSLSHDGDYAIAQVILETA